MKDVIDEDIITESKSLMGDKFSMVIEYFIEDTVGYISEIENAIKENDTSKAIAPAHTIKSSAKQLGVLRVFELAKNIEEFCRNNNNSSNISELEKFYTELKKEASIAEKELKKIC